jgi:hypothetical protein
MVRRTSKLLAAATAAALLGWAGAAGAATCVGSCGSAGANGDVTAPPSAPTYGWVSTFGGVVGAGQLPGIGGTDGSSFTTSAFSANAGDVLKYDFNFVSSDGQDAPGQFIFEDYASVQLVDAGTGNPVAVLFDARAEPTLLAVPGAGLPPIDPGVTLTPSSASILAGTGTQGNFAGGPVWSPLGAYSGWCWGAGCGLTGWINSTFTVQQAGSYQLVFGVTNWGDQIYDTGLAYSGIQIGGRDIEDTVPEPSVWALMILGFGGVGAALRARRWRSARGFA